MIRQPAVFFVQEKPKQIQRFLVDQHKSTIESNQETILETEPLLNHNQKRRKSILVELVENVKNKLPKLLNRKEMFEEFEIEPNLEIEYTWWTKFYNSIKVFSKRFKVVFMIIYQRKFLQSPEQINESLHQLKVK